MVSVAAPWVVMAAAAVLAATSEALVLCPTFPRCCVTQSCWFLCPSCSEAKYFINGVRITPKNPEPCPDYLRLVVPDPYAFPDDEKFPEEDHCAEYNTYGPRSWPYLAKGLRLRHPGRKRRGNP